MSPKSFRIAGTLAMSSALLSIPFLILSYYFSRDDFPYETYYQSAMHITGIIIFTSVTYLLKKLLHDRHFFQDADNYIDFLIITNLIAGIASTARLYLPQWADALDQFSIILIAAFGITQVLFGFRLLKLPDNLNGMLRPYCFITIITGLFISTVVLLPLGVITGAISDVMLGTIFFQSREKAIEPDAR